MFLLSRPVYGVLLDVPTVKGGHTLTQDIIDWMFESFLELGVFCVKVDIKDFKSRVVGGISSQHTI